MSIGCAEVSLLLLHAEEHLRAVEALSFSFEQGGDSFSHQTVINKGRLDPRRISLALVAESGEELNKTTS